MFFKKWLLEVIMRYIQIEIFTSLEPVGTKNHEFFFHNISDFWACVAFYKRTYDQLMNDN